MSSKGVNILLENKDGRIALQLRDDIYKWGIFGGWIEPDEDPSQAAIREIREELCSTLYPEKLTFLKIFQRSDHVAYVFHYPVTTELDNAVLTEGAAYKFMLLSELKDKTVVSWHLEILEWYWTR